MYDTSDLILAGALGWVAGALTCAMWWFGRAVDWSYYRERLRLGRRRRFGARME